MKNYVITHLHSIYSVGDSTTDPQIYVDKAKELGMKAIAFTEHGNVYNFIKKKQMCDKAGIKFIMGVETYLTKTHDEKIKDNYHTILIAKNKSGIEELLNAITIATDKEHTYYKPRLSFEEFCNLSDNIITTSACLGSPLANLDENDEWYEKLIKRYDYLEIQPHAIDRQIRYNKKLFELSQKYDKPLISGSDTHEIDAYKQECRAIWLIGKGYDDDVREFDLTFKSYDELIDMYKKQNALPDEVWLDAIENTNRLADSVDDFELDYSFKYPDIYSNPYDEMFKKAYDELNRQIENGILADNMFDVYSNRIDEELQVFDKQGMCSFILFMSQLLVWCREQNIPIGFGRGSVTGSLVCYLLKITDVDAIEWKTNFARFVNDGRISLGDIDTDVSPDDRAKVYAYIRNQFTDEKSAYITTFQKLKVNRIIDDVGRALNMPEYEKARIKKGYNDLELKMKAIQKEFENDKITQKEFDAKELEIEREIDEYMSQFKDVFQYYKGLSGAISAVGIHACFHEDTLITTKSGYKKIKDVAVGDYVLTHNNRYREVVDVMCRRSNDNIKVNVRGNRIITTKDHPFLSKDGIGEETKWVRAEELNGKYVGIHINIDSDSIEWNGVTKDINQYVKNVNIKNITDEVIYSESFMRFCGRFAGDGWIQRHRTRSITSICCALDEFDELKEILDNIPFTYCYHKYERTYRFTLHDKELCEFMKQFGQGAKNKIVPAWIFSMEKELREAFFLGYLSADGHTNKNTIMWNSVSKKLTLGIGQLATSVYLRPFRMFKSRDSQKATILGREVNQNARYDGTISSSYSRFYFIEDGIMWVKAKIEEYESEEIDVYNLSVYEDNSYCADSVIVHNCGMIGSPINLISSIGLYKNDKKDCWVSQCDMKNVDSVNYVKYDILSLKTLQVVRDAFKMAGRKYPNSYEVNWKDEKVFEDMITSPVGLFQMESQSSFEYLKKLKPKSVEDISFVNAIIRPSCASFRDNAIQKILNKNPTKEIDELLSSTYGYLIYQEQIIEFLQKICGFTASEADTIRRAIGKKDKALLDMWLPKVEEGYVKNSSKATEEATKDFHTFYIILQQASDYGFSRNHSIAYSMMTYLTAYVRYYYPKEFICAYMNNATDESDTTNAIVLSRLKDIDIMPAKYGYSIGDDVVRDNKIYKGVKNVLNVSGLVGDNLYEHSKENEYKSFTEALDGIMELPSTNKTNIETLIKIDYFEEFGKAKKLLKLFQIYQDMQGRKQMNKDSKVLQDRPGIKKLIIRKLKDNAGGYSCTPKMYKIDWRDIVETVERMLPNEDFTTKERIENQLSYLHYIKDNNLKKYNIGVVKFKSKYDSWCINIGDSDYWYKNLSGKEIDKNDLILINNASEYKDSRGRLQRNLMDIDILTLDRKTQDKK